MRKGDQTRRKILEKAAPIFNTKGYSGTAVADLIEATGLQKGGIYRHFASKEELAADAFDYAWSVVSQPRYAALTTARSGAERLQRMVESFAEHAPDNMPGGCPLLNTAIEADDTNPVLRKRARKALEQWMAHVREAVAQGIHERQLRENTNANEVAVVLISTLEGALMISRLERNREALKHAKEHLFRLIESLKVS